MYKILHRILLICKDHLDKSILHRLQRLYQSDMHYPCLSCIPIGYHHHPNLYCNTGLPDKKKQVTINEF